jgi:3-hydroxyacyl-CoA dehydrogenase/enoyl-CoA hydratase/3-hydroxybutyryl-CoA epimerase
MGAGIAHLAASRAELPIRLKDKDDVALARGLSYVRGLLDESVARRRITPAEAACVLSRVTVSQDYTGFGAADLVIEAVYEDLELKRRMLAEVEAAGHPQVIFATNTSSLPIQSIAARARHPERVIGMHYFSPVHRMPLLEVVVTDQTAAWVTATVVAFGKKLGKTVIVVHDGPGFYTSRILAPYLNESLYLLNEGVAIEAIDRALIEYGFPVGPIALVDEIGIDVASKVAGTLLEAFGARLRQPDLTRKLINDGRLGRKNGRGFYRYDEASKSGKRPVDPSVYATLGLVPNRDVDASEIVERCLLSMVNEAARCLDEGILRSARDGDVGAIFGLGFPPYLGGPLRYADSVGASVLIGRLERLVARHGERFEPAPGLRELAARGRKFHA